mmetsp:Transcript_15680/g.18076  ORF Transcript_15680/g.18076 Transcript_15680/m.18076 type:complete len:204 (+) Transcript_15680:544-1155(+)
MEGSFGFVEHLVGSSTEDNGARFSRFAPAETDDFVFPDHDFFDNVAFSQSYEFGVIESGYHLPTRHGGQSLDSVKIGVFDRHDFLLGEDALGVIVNQLPIDKNVAPVVADLVHLDPHLGPLGILNLGHLHQGINLHFRTVNLDFIGIHARISDQNLGVLDATGLTDPHALIQEESFLEIRITQTSTGFLDDLDIIQIVTPPQP